MKLYTGGLKLPQGQSLDNILKTIPSQIFKELVRSDGEGLSKYSAPQVIQGTDSTRTIPSQIFRNYVDNILTHSLSF